MFKLRVGQSVPLAQQHQLEHRQGPIRLGTAAVYGLVLVQTLELVRDLVPVQQLLQLHRWRVLDQRPDAHDEETVHGAVAPQPSTPRIREVMQRFRRGN